MNNRTIHALLTSSFALLVYPASAQADNSQAATSPMQNQMVKITDSGLEPSTIEMRKEDRIVFFVNDSKESLVTLNLTFGARATHCASENLRIGEDGSVQSVKPIPPKDFAATCFHDLGSYPFSVSGIQGSSKSFKGTIIVR